MALTLAESLRFEALGWTPCIQRDDPSADGLDSAEMTSLIGALAPRAVGTPVTNIDARPCLIELCRLFAGGQPGQGLAGDGGVDGVQAVQQRVVALAVQDAAQHRD
jgi:hypothetical protein